MPPADRLEVLHVHQPPDPAGLEQLLQHPRVRRVAQHMADRQDDPVALRGSRDRLGVLLGRRHRLLQQQVIAEISQPYCGRGVQLILRRDDRRIRQPPGIGEVGPIGVPVFVRYAELFAERRPADGIGLGDRGHPRTAVPDRAPGVQLPPQTAAHQS